MGEEIRKGKREEDGKQKEEGILGRRKEKEEWERKRKE